MHAGNCSSPSLRDPFHRTRPPPPAPLQRRPPQPRWRHLRELTSEGTSPVMTSASPALCSGRNSSRLPQPRRSCSRRIQPGSDLGAFAPTRRGGTARDDLHQSRGGFLLEATPPFRSTNHEAPSANSPTSIMWVGLAGRGSSGQVNLEEAEGVLAAGVSGPLALQDGTVRVVDFDLWSCHCAIVSNKQRFGE